jgi:hypothetical protein
MAGSYLTAGAALDQGKQGATPLMQFAAGGAATFTY